MQKVQPLLQEIQTKFADDPVRQREEMQRLYAETKFNPLAGCLPMLLLYSLRMLLRGNRRQKSTGAGFCT